MLHCIELPIFQPPYNCAANVLPISRRKCINIHACRSLTLSCQHARNPAAATVLAPCKMATETSSSLNVRALELEDYDKGYLTMLAQLTTVGDISREKFEERFKELSESPDYHIAVIEDLDSGKIVGTAAAIIERKFIHECGKVGHIEDVVVDAEVRGKRLGQRLIEDLLRVCKERGCYKVILDCAEHNVAFYEKCGLTKKEVQMVKYFDR